MEKIRTIGNGNNNKTLNKINFMDILGTLIQ